MSKKITESINESYNRRDIRYIKLYAQRWAKKKRLEYEGIDLEGTETIPTALHNVDLSGKEMAQVKIPPVALSVLCGLIFGDGGITKSGGYKRARITFKHSTRQTDWFFWKTHCALSFFIPRDTSILFLCADGKQVRASGETKSLPGEILGKWQVNSQVNDELTKLYHILTSNGKKEVKRNWLNHMNNYFLMTLWLDDGSLLNQIQGVFCLNKTPERELIILRDYLRAVWGVETHVSRETSRSTETNPIPFSLVFCDCHNLLLFLRIIAPIIPVKSMLYKVCYFHSNPVDRQRWTSDLKKMVRKDWHDYIDEYYLGIAAIKQGQEIAAEKKKAVEAKK